MMSFLIVVILFVLSGVLFQARISYTSADYSTQKTENHAQLEANSGHLNSIAIVSQELYCPVSPLQFISTGFDEHLPNRLRMNAFSSYDFDNITRINPLFPEYNVLDWAFIISVVMSFIALTLTFDAITAEKENGTLRSVLANSLGRRQFLLAKFLSAIIVLMILLTVGMLLNLIIITIAHPEIVRLSVVPPLFMTYLVSILYLSLFVVAGLFISSITRRSAISLVLSLVCWVILVLIIPNLGNLIAQTFFPIAPTRDVEAKISLTTEDIYKNAPGEVWSCFSTDVTSPCYRMRAEMNQKLLASSTAIRSAYHLEQLRQVEIGRTWIKLSPTAIYQSTLAKLANAGVDRVIDFENQASEYRRGLLTFVHSKDAQDPTSSHLIDPYDNQLISSKPVDGHEIPIFSYSDPSNEKLFNESVGNIGLIFLQGIVLFGMTLMAFDRYDVR
jgi:ABC-type transport system involved in multi-copper enzyme maturation permease subunit